MLIPLNVLTFNTHIGQALRNDSLGWLVDRAPGAHIILLQEVPDLESVHAAMRRAEMLRTWRILPKNGFQRRGLPYILVRKRRFTLKFHNAPNISNGSRHARARAAAVLFDKRTNRDVWLANVHTDPLGLGFGKANPGARKIHISQTDAYADFFQDAPVFGSVEIAGGDWNERLAEPIQQQRDPLSSRTATQTMRRVGLVPSRDLLPRGKGNREVRLDEIFVSPQPYVRVIGRRLMDPPGKADDHNAVLTRMRIERIEKKEIPKK